ncbi:Uncharacterised protein [Mycobacteroides abscessus subsp. massiliense]|uniref:hypothetical protein n=1 Tax=Mycobacteroides abscessus TaxID=36809 RepID=UPI0009C43502|nr:Uncharacterised protein [Mycobacteroides abscessus subsp. massiliense]SKG29232.1 Uncharacterised protein [Mycobacteroides abscessus subsp. massiliense]SKH69037.1 Uncharacterised protein [Mycobacteroides abscessus subsp. massiliense]SKI50701.1 Uncharacterised protein [Mycobacteroides abscessus subsp. massiliense]
MPTPRLVSQLRDQLGRKLVAYLGNAKESRAVDRWVEGTRGHHSAKDVQRLRLAFQAAQLIIAQESKEVVQAWFQGLNPLLGDISPARLLREGNLDADGPRVIAAARQFTVVG